MVPSKYEICRIRVLKCYVKILQVVNEISNLFYKNSLLLNLFFFRGISFLLSSLVFHVLPTVLEISLVCGILVMKLFYNRLSVSQF